MKDDHLAVLLKDMNSKFDAVTEAVTDLSSDVKELKKLIPDVAELKSDVKVIKAVVVDQSHQIRDHDSQISSLEAA
jgi:phage-related minor tail protein